MIQIGCCSFVFRRVLEESLPLVSTLGFTQVDVGATGPDSELDPERIISAPTRWARKVRKLAERHALTLNELFATPMRVNGQQVEPNEPDATLRRLGVEQFQRLCAFAASAGFQSVMGVPGTPQPGLSDEAALELSITTLRRMVAIAEQEGVWLNVEPWHGSIVNKPDLALALIEAVPGLAYTLDYTHFVGQGIDQAEAAPLLAHARHMHGKQTRPGQWVSQWQEGVIDYAPILERLVELDWEGVITMEYAQRAVSGLSDTAVFQNVVGAFALEQSLRQISGAPQ